MNVLNNKAIEILIRQVSNNKLVITWNITLERVALQLGLQHFAPYTEANINSCLQYSVIKS
jgi:hypothetical protein